MPEIVEAEKLIRQLQPAWVGRTVTNLWAVPKADKTFMKLVKNQPTGTLSNLICGAKILDMGRVGKQILTHILSNEGQPYIWRVHLGHTGWWQPGNEEAIKQTVRDPIADNFIHTLPESTVRAKMMLDDGQRHDFYDPRTFSRWYVHTPDEWIKVARKEFGPDWLTDPQAAGDAVVKRLYNLTNIHSVQTIKEVLLDQKVAAGLGNYLVCEILHRAGIRPQTPIMRLNVTQISRIVTKTSAFIDTSFNSPDHSHWLVFQRGGVLCKTCQATYIERLPEGTRSSYFCPVCQPHDDLRS